MNYLLAVYKFIQRMYISKKLGHLLDSFVNLKVDFQLSKNIIQELLNCDIKHHSQSVKNTYN